MGIHHQSQTFAYSNIVTTCSLTQQQQQQVEIIIMSSVVHLLEGEYTGDVFEGKFQGEGTMTYATGEVSHGVLC